MFLRSRSFLAGLVLSSWEVHFVYCLGHTVHMENGGFPQDALFNYRITYRILPIRLLLQSGRGYFLQSGRKRSYKVAVDKCFF